MDCQNAIPSHCQLTNRNVAKERNRIGAVVGRQGRKLGDQGSGTFTGFEVHPCIATVPATFEPVVDPGEFDSMFHAPLRAFADHSIFELSFIEDGGPGRWVPHYQLGDDNIWGVTAAVLAQLANLLYDAGFDLKRNWGQDP